ncbi:hypothetical protein GCM10028864_45150 [Microlunatus parietis]
MRDGRPVSVGGPQQQALLGILLLNANNMVPADRLIGHLWGDRPPASARSLLQGCVAHLRRDLADERTDRQFIVRRGPGYALELDPGDLDLDRFDALVDAARDAAEDRTRAGLEHRAALLRRALRLWRGAVLDGIVLDGCEPELTRLEERRLAVLEECAGVELELGRHAEVVPELQAVVRIHPLREQLRTLLMAALAGCGRRGEALAAYRELRTTLVDELGVEPSATVQALHQRILATDEPGQPTTIELAAARPAWSHADPAPSAEQVVRRTSAGGRSIAWSAVGSGPPLVVANWSFGHLELDWRNPAFQRFVGRLARQHTVIRYDRPGTGLSGPATGTRPSLDEETAVLEAVIDAATATLVGDSAAPVGLFGCSSGSGIAAGYAARWPERVERLVLYGGYARGLDLAPAATREALVRIVAAHRGLGSQVLAGLLLPGGTVAERDGFARLQRAVAGQYGAAQALEAAFAADVSARLGRIRTPTLVLHRRADRTVPFPLGQDLAARIPGAAFVALDGLDHLPWHGEPETLVRLVIDFAGADPAATRSLGRLERGAPDIERVA